MSPEELFNSVAALDAKVQQYREALTRAEMAEAKLAQVERERDEALASRDRIAEIGHSQADRAHRALLQLSEARTALHQAREIAIERGDYALELGAQLSTMMAKHHAAESQLSEAREQIAGLEAQVQSAVDGAQPLWSGEVAELLAALGPFAELKGRGAPALRKPIQVARDILRRAHATLNKQEPDHG